MDEKYRALLRQTSDVIRTEAITRANRGRAHAVIVDFIKLNPQMTYPEIARAVGLHSVTVNRIALGAGEKRGRGRRRAAKNGLAASALGGVQTSQNPG